MSDPEATQVDAAVEGGEERESVSGEVGGDMAGLNMFPLRCDGGESCGSVKAEYKENSLSGKMWQPHARLVSA